MSDAPRPDPKRDAKEAQARILAEFEDDPWLAHASLFKRRHPDASPAAHLEAVRFIHSPNPRGLLEGFRGFGKSTLLEETALIRAGYRRFRNMLIVGASYARACERLAPIKREIEQNELLAMAFGPMKGAVWQEGKIVLASGICIQALGRDQSMLGTKYLDWRPDAALVDDVEDPEEVRTDEQRRQTWDWFLKTFLPSLDHPLYSWVRVLGTRRGQGSLPERLERDRWPVRKFPIEYIDPAGARQAAWPAKFPLDVIDRMRSSYREDMHTWSQEYMCEATSASARSFAEGMLKVVPRQRSWHAVYAMIDPARTTHAKSASTGWAVWSWIGARLVVWAAGAEMLRPDEIVDLSFRIAEGWNPVEIGVEEDGLNEWLMQPLRHEMARRRTMIPVRAMRAPRSKLDFILGLQHFFAGGDVEFAHDLSELRAQLLSFPAGRIDAPNALAYALLMKPTPVYDGFGADNIEAELQRLPGRPLYLAANAARGHVTAALVQFVDGHLRVIADWVVEGQPAEIAPRLHMEAAIEGETVLRASRQTRDWGEMLKLDGVPRDYARVPLRWVLPPQHWDQWNNVGLAQAVQRIPAQPSRGGGLAEGHAFLADRLTRLGHGGPAVIVAERAGWTLRALAGGYARSVVRGRLGEEPDQNVYRTLMEGLEAFCATMAVSDSQEDNDEGGNFAVSKEGRRYLSAMPVRRRG